MTRPICVFQALPLAIGQDEEGEVPEEGVEGAKARQPSVSFFFRHASLPVAEMTIFPLLVLKGIYHDTYFPIFPGVEKPLNEPQSKPG